MSYKFTALMFRKRSTFYLLPSTAFHLDLDTQEGTVICWEPLSSTFTSVISSVTRFGEISPLGLFLKVFGNSQGFVLYWAKLRAQIDSFYAIGVISNVAISQLLKT